MSPAYLSLRTITSPRHASTTPWRPVPTHARPDRQPDPPTIIAEGRLVDDPAPPEICRHDQHVLQPAALEATHLPVDLHVELDPQHPETGVDPVACDTSDHLDRMVQNVDVQVIPSRDARVDARQVPQGAMSRMQGPAGDRPPLLPTPVRVRRGSRSSQERPVGAASPPRADSPRPRRPTTGRSRRAPPAKVAKPVAPWSRSRFGTPPGRIRRARREHAPAPAGTMPAPKRAWTDRDSWEREAGGEPSRKPLQQQGNGTGRRHHGGGAAGVIDATHQPTAPRGR